MFKHGDIDSNMLEAAKYGRIDEVKALLARGADIKARYWMDQTALMLAAQRHHNDIVKTLLLRGADIKDPSIISLDGVISSIMVTEFLALVTGFRQPRQYLLYDMMTGDISPIEQSIRDDCFHKKMVGKGIEDLMRYFK